MRVTSPGLPPQAKQARQPVEHLLDGRSDESLEVIEQMTYLMFIRVPDDALSPPVPWRSCASWWNPWARRRCSWSPSMRTWPPGPSPGRLAPPFSLRIPSSPFPPTLPDLLRGHDAPKRRRAGRGAGGINPLTLQPDPSSGCFFSFYPHPLEKQPFRSRRTRRKASASSAGVSFLPVLTQVVSRAVMAEDRTATWVAVSSISTK